MTIFLTGATGFVGSHVVEALLEEDREVVALVRETSETEHLQRLGVEMVVGELERPEELADTLVEVDEVIHIAGLVSAQEPASLYRVNARGTRRLVDCVAEVAGDDTSFVYVSSVSAQGPAKGQQPRPPGRAPRPVSHYGRSKLEGEGAVLAHRDRLDVTILRPPVIYGPRDRDVFEVFQLADRRLSPVIGGDDRWLSVVHAEDVARAVVASLRAPGDGEVYTIDDGNCYTWSEFGDAIAEAVGKRTLSVPLPRQVFAAAAAVAEFGGGFLGTTSTFNLDKYREMVQPSWVCGHQKIRSELGWEPNWELEEGAVQTAEWYREQGWL